MSPDVVIGCGRRKFHEKAASLLSSVLPHILCISCLFFEAPWFIFKFIKTEECRKIKIFFERFFSSISSFQTYYS
jgi:hypothetical protein